MHATGPIHGMWWSCPTAQPTYPNMPTSMLNIVRTSLNSGSYTPRLLCHPDDAPVVERAGEKHREGDPNEAR